MTVHARWAALVAALFLAATAPAAAQQPAPNPNDAAYDEARKRFGEGKRLIREGKREGNASKLETAYLEFKEAYALYPHAKAALLNLVESEILTGRRVDAMKHLRQFASEHGTPEGADEYGKAFQQYWDSAFKATGHIEVDAPPGARILVDNEDVGFAPLATPVDVSPGPHAVGMGAQRVRAETDAGAGSTVRVSVASPAPAAAAGSSVSPSTAPPSGAMPPVSSAPASPGPDESNVPTFWTPTAKWGAVLGGAGLVALGVGAVFAVRNKNDADRADDLSRQLGPSGCGAAVQAMCGDLQTARNDQSTDFTLASVFLGLGGTAVAAGAVLLLWPKRSYARAAVVPMVWTQGAAIQIRGELF